MTRYRCPMCEETRRFEETTMGTGDRVDGLDLYNKVTCFCGYKGLAALFQLYAFRRGFGDGVVADIERALESIE